MRTRSFTSERTWQVFEKDREYAGVIGDRVICEVRAITKEQAEEKARKKAQFITGPWAAVKTK